MFGTKVKLDQELYKRCKQQAELDGYSSVEEFVGHLLERELRKVEQKTKEEQGKVLNQLRGLGYIE